MLNLIHKLKANKYTCNSLLKSVFNNNKYIISKNFSNQNISKNYKKLLEELDFESEEDKDLRYEDQLFFLEREMDKLRNGKKEFGQDYATSDFPEYQQREISTLIDVVKGFDFVEKEYFYNRLNDYLEKACNSDLSKQNSFTLSLNVKIQNDISKLNPNNEIIDKIIFPLAPYLASDIFVGGGGPSTGAVTDKKEAAKEEKKEEKPKEVN